MNGRCTADPLDHADDVCEFCGDEFCSSCLLRTRNGKGPLVCRECAIGNSGVKGSKHSKPRVSKAHVQRARAQLLENADGRDDGGFRYFDDEAGWVDPGAGVEVDAAADSASKSSGRRFRRRGKSEPAVERADLIDEEPTEIEDAPNPPHPASPRPAESPAMTPYISDTATTAVDAPLGHDAPPSPVVPPEPFPQDLPAPSETPLADRIRGTAAPVPAPLDSAPLKSEPLDSAPLGIDPFSLDHDPFSSPEPEPQPVPTAASEQPTNPWSFPATVPASEPAPSGFDWHGTDQPGVTPIHATPDNDPFGTQEQPTVAPTPEPLAPAFVAEHVPSSDRAPRPQPAAAPEQSVPAALVAKAQGTSAVEADVQPSADLDSNGNWIPPVLRGIAPIEERRSQALPRRRETD